MFPPVSAPRYDDLLRELQLLSVDYCTELGGKINAHIDVLSMADVDEDGNETPTPDVHPAKLLRAQLGLDGAEDEVELIQKLISVLSNIIMIRKARYCVFDSSNLPLENTD